MQMKLIKNCFSLTKSSQQSQDDALPESVASWNTEQVKMWLKANNLGHLESKFTDFNGADLLHLTSDKYPQMISNKADYKSLKKQVTFLKARYVDYLVRRGIPLPLVDNRSQRKIQHSASKSAAELKAQKTPKPNPVLGIVDPTQRMQIVARTFCGKFGEKGKFFTVEQARFETGIPLQFIHDLVNCLSSVHIISPLNDGYVWWGTQRLQIKDRKRYADNESDEETIASMVKMLTNPQVINLSSVTPWVVQIMRNYDYASSIGGKPKDAGITQYTITRELTRQYLKEENCNMDLLNELVRDACIILSAAGVLSQHKSLNTNSFKWILPQDENIRPANSQQASTSSPKPINTSVLNQTKYFDMPGAVPLPAMMHSPTVPSPPRLTPRSAPLPGGDSPIPLQERVDNSINILYGSVEFRDPGNVTSLKKMFQGMVKK
eukprot:TRINITY_DN33538_c1_g1_i2.p2 TRINITY_DN33538_c1_g1~~TRINITY_DN33538_c1_g1_i2.p2  ORF type:complete len:435 (+),score=43.48 TRINITY_DN33538_c1_g1_i2:123-1427(+)